MNTLLELENVLSALLLIIRLKSEEDYRHAKRVSYFSLAIGDYIGLGGDDMIRLRVASLLHDIGKLGILGSVLSKAAELTRGEWAMIKKHPVFSMEIIRELHFDEMSERTAAEYHENWNGTGYPNKLKGEEICVPARILKIADVYDALRSERPYRHAMDRKAAIEFMYRVKSNFDPNLLDIFAGMNMPDPPADL